MNGYNLDSLFVQTPAQTKRLSSYDVSGGNHDWIDIEPGETRQFAHIEGTGIIRHIWCTHWTGGEDWSEEPGALRNLILRIYWDEEESASVTAPLGDFFGMPFGRRINFQSAAFGMAPEDGRGMNCFWPMPFRKKARFTLESQCQEPTKFYFYIDYEAWDKLPFDDQAGYFHARFNREPNTKGWGKEEIGLLDREKANVPEEPDWLPAAWLTKNTDGKGNYVILEAVGKGRYVGCNMGVNITTPQCNEWYGEGDDMIFIDGESWPPNIHGTGTEDYFSTAFCPTQTFHAPFHGLTIYSGDATKKGYKFDGENAMYRLHIQDPIQFTKSIKVTIEHGHANKLSGDWCSTAYWYQTEPHLALPESPNQG